MLKTISGALLVLASLSIVACNTESTQTYDLNIEWTIGGSKDCNASFNKEDVALVGIEIALYESEADAQSGTGPIEKSNAMCASNTHQVSRLQRGKYWVTVQAIGRIDGRDLPLYEGVQKVSVPVVDDKTVRFTLIQATGEILMEWNFPRLCGFATANEVASVEISSSFDSITVPCTDGSYTFEDVIAGEYEITMTALDIKGNILGTVNSDEPFMLYPGESYNEFLKF